MALVQYGGGILDARGSIGGQVHSRNASGNYIRARTTGVNPNSPAQALIRSRIAVMGVHWNTILTQAQRDAWETYANAIVRTNKLGAAIKLSGFNHYCRSNSFRRYHGVARASDGPTNLTLAPQDGSMVATVDEANQEISVAFDDTLDWVDQSLGFMAIYMSQPHTPGTSFIGGPFRVAGIILGDDTTPPTTPQTIAVPFPVAQGQQIAVRARISEEDGRLSDYFRSQTAVAA